MSPRITACLLLFCDIFPASYFFENSSKFSVPAGFSVLVRVVRNVYYIGKKVQKVCSTGAGK